MLPCLSTANSCRYSINGEVDETSLSAASALVSFCISASVAGPSDGSVTFCEATAPTPAVAHAHRAATAGDEDEIAIPNIPVVLHLATIENVIFFWNFEFAGDSVPLLVVIWRYLYL